MLGTGDREESDSKLEEKIDAFMLSIQREEEVGIEDEGEGRKEEVLREVEATSGHTEENAPGWETGEAPSIRGSEAEVRIPDEFGYENFHISALHFLTDNSDPVAEALREEFLGAEDCLQHV